MGDTSERQAQQAESPGVVQDRGPQIGAAALGGGESDVNAVETTMVDLSSVPLSALVDPSPAPALGELAATQTNLDGLVTAGGHNS